MTISYLGRGHVARKAWRDIEIPFTSRTVKLSRMRSGVTRMTGSCAMLITHDRVTMVQWFRSQVYHRFVCLSFSFSFIIYYKKRFCRHILPFLSYINHHHSLVSYYFFRHFLKLFHSVCFVCNRDINIATYSRSFMTSRRFL